MLLCNYDPITHLGIARATQKLNWQLNVSMLNSFETPTHWRGDGIVCSLNNNKKLVDFVLDSKLPCVDLSSWRIDLDLPRVAADNEAIGKQAVDHFCSFGHRSFGWFCHQQNTVAKERFQSFSKELTHRGFQAPSHFVGTRTQNTREIKTWLGQLKKPTALLAYNDNDAAWLLSSCIELGYRVPQDFAILGIDNNPLICNHQPIPLSSINHNHERIGYEGALLLDAIINEKSLESHRLSIRPNGVTPRASTDSLATQDHYVRHTITILNQQLNKSIGAPEIAQQLGISRRNLEIRFNRALDTSIHKKLIEMRLSKVSELLTTTELSIEDIVAKTGFCNSSHLCRSFKSQNGESPLAFRKAIRRREQFDS